MHILIHSVFLVLSIILVLILRRHFRFASTDAGITAEGTFYIINQLVRTY